MSDFTPAARWEACPTRQGSRRELRTRARLLISQGMGQVAVRRAADRLEATAARSGYRRRRHLDHPPDAEALVAAATERARDGDEDALRLLYLLYADNVFGYVLAIVHDEHDAEDITSEVFARLPRALSHYRVSATPSRLALAGRPKRCARPPASAAFGAPGRGPGAERAELQAHERLDGLRAALEALPDDQRQVMLLRLDRRAHARRGRRAARPLGGRRPRAPAPRPPAAARGAHPGRLGADVASRLARPRTA